MKCLLMIYGNREKWESLPAADWPAAIAKQDAFNARYQETVELLGACGSPTRQALDAGLVDEVRLHVTPVVLGRGVPLFGTSRANLRCVEAIHGEGAVHLRYGVR